eukprot:CAMPEP_0175951544 /NCGR_PEP_ID=MMETSP0108-20121206/30259_1 /TAXON_ID=195067 ORGANISM="Goniomonas pacifica, Strain CCMP1869" /NCGR_SAMPLE_ID=MMETSP0108 /ASSEMBLY_ACC=CAM_ASM_000204 /LENGTH=64 /DNA_ID=CAMNT_0017277815 /DNA_START=472 /DNA_END=666 /DNA_ORIENTATION=-
MQELVSSLSVLHEHGRQVHGQDRVWGVPRLEQPHNAKCAAVLSKLRDHRDILTPRAAFSVTANV